MSASFEQIVPAGRHALSNRSQQGLSREYVESGLFPSQLPNPPAAVPLYMDLLNHPVDPSKEIVYMETLPARTISSFSASSPSKRTSLNAPRELMMDEGAFVSRTPLQFDPHPRSHAVEPHSGQSYYSPSSRDRATGAPATTPNGTKSVAWVTPVEAVELENEIAELDASIAARKREAEAHARLGHPAAALSIAPHDLSVPPPPVAFVTMPEAGTAFRSGQPQQQQRSPTINTSESSTRAVGAPPSPSSRTLPPAVVRALSRDRPANVPLSPSRLHGRTSSASGMPALGPSSPNANGNSSSSSAVIKGTSAEQQGNPLKCNVL